MAPKFNPNADYSAAQFDPSAEYSAADSGASSAPAPPGELRKLTQRERFEMTYPVGVKGVGEPPMGASAAALVNAISDALGGVTFNRTPISTDMILNALSGRPQAHRPLQVNTV